ncbi:MAG: hypothetical protein M3468_03035 [Acidobacteriota bacterium]|nr:hypothetical protein [Acidobacteriota bacterium]
MDLGIGVPELLILTVLGIIPLGGILFVVLLLNGRAKRLNYPSTGAYLRAAPRSDAEKQDAADLVLKGLVFCVLGLLFPPFVLIGLVPLFYGGRKLLYASMGLGLIDDPEPPRA